MSKTPSFFQKDEVFLNQGTSFLGICFVVSNFDSQDLRSSFS